MQVKLKKATKKSCTNLLATSKEMHTTEISAHDRAILNQSARGKLSIHLWNYTKYRLPI
jgi:hypothetical protein